MKKSLAFLLLSAPAIALPDGYELSDWAEPFDVDYPTALTAAADGTVYVSVDKNGSLGKEKNMGKIVSCRDTNGDGKVGPEEHEMYLEFKRKELEDADAMRDAQRTMAWYSLGGMLMYPIIVVLATVFNMDQAAKILGDMAVVYFIAVAGIVAAFFGAQALSKPKK